MVLIFWIHVQKGHRFFLNFRDVLEKLPPWAAILYLDTRINKKVPNRSSKVAGMGGPLQRFLFHPSICFQVFNVGTLVNVSILKLRT
jgi:hypothetical protein